MSVSGMEGETGHDTREMISEQTSHVDPQDQILVSSRTVDLNLHLAPPSISSDVETRYHYMSPSTHSQNLQHQLNIVNPTHINYGPVGMSIESIHQGDITPYAQDHTNLQRNFLYSATTLQRPNNVMVVSRASPLHLHQTIQDQLQSFQQEQQQGFDIHGFQETNDHMLQFRGQDVTQATTFEGGQEDIQGATRNIDSVVYPGRRIPHHVRQQRLRRRARANRAYITHINSVAAEMALVHEDASLNLPGGIPENPHVSLAEIDQSSIHIAVPADQLEGFSTTMLEDPSGPLGENFECNICFQKANEAIVTCCGHLFCWPCLYRWLHIHSLHKECPVCKGAINECSITPIYGRETTSTVARMQGVLGVERIPPRPQARRVESARQLREREERGREREIQDHNEYDQNLDSNANLDNPTLQENSIGVGTLLGNGGDPNSRAEGNILIQIDHRELNGINTDTREVGNTLNFENDSEALVFQQRQESHINTSINGREDNYATIYMDGHESGNIMHTTSNSWEDSNGIPNQLDARTRDIFHDLQTIEDAQPNLLRGGASMNSSGGFLFENPSVELLHQRMALRRQQLHGALFASRSLDSIDYIENRQTVMQAASRLSQEWDDLIHLSRVDMNPGQATAWLAAMNTRLVNMETNHQNICQLSHDIPLNIPCLATSSLNTTQRIANDSSRPLPSLQSRENLAAMQTRFNNMQGIITTLQQPSYVNIASLPPLQCFNFEPTTSAWNQLHSTVPRIPTSEISDESYEFHHPNQETSNAIEFEQGGDLKSWPLYPFPSQIHNNGATVEYFGSSPMATPSLLATMEPECHDSRTDEEGQFVGAIGTQYANVVVDTLNLENGVNGSMLNVHRRWRGIEDEREGSRIESSEEDIQEQKRRRVRYIA